MTKEALEKLVNDLEDQVVELELAKEKLEADVLHSQREFDRVHGERMNWDQDYSYRNGLEARIRNLEIVNGDLVRDLANKEESVKDERIKELERKLVDMVMKS
jgi:hypothetical protein